MNKFQINNNPFLESYWSAWVGDVLVLGDRANVARVEPNLRPVIRKRKLSSSRLPTIRIGDRTLGKTESDAVWASVGILACILGADDPRLWLRPQLEFVHLATGSNGALPIDDAALSGLLGTLSTEQEGMRPSPSFPTEGLGSFLDIRQDGVTTETASMSWQVAGHCEVLACWPCLNDVSMDWESIENRDMHAIIAGRVPTTGWVDHIEAQHNAHRSAMVDFDNAFGPEGDAGVAAIRQVLMAHPLGQVAIIRDVHSSRAIWRTCHGRLPKMLIDMASRRWVVLIYLPPFAEQSIALSGVLLCGNPSWGEALVRASAPCAVSASQLVWVRFPDMTVEIAATWAKAVKSKGLLKLAATQIKQSVVRRSGNDIRLVSGPLPTVAARDLTSGCWVCVGAASRHAVCSDIMRHNNSRTLEVLLLRYGQPMQWRRSSKPCAPDHNNMPVKPDRSAWIVATVGSSYIRKPQVWPMDGANAVDTIGDQARLSGDRAANAGVGLRWLAEIHGNGVPVWFGTGIGAPPASWSDGTREPEKMPSVVRTVIRRPGHKYALGWPQHTG